MSFVVVSLALITFFIICNGYVHPDLGLNEKQLIKQHGYPLEVHTAQSQDGYLLELHRIPYGRNKKKSKNRPAVLLVPGILWSSQTFILYGPDSGLGYVLADNGYDVWMANNRGTTWSKRHVHLNSSSDNKEYWSFSLQELGAYDLPAFIDYILNVTKQENLTYIGFSQGTTIFYIMMSERPEYNKKVNLMVSLGTALDLRNATIIFNTRLSLFKDLEYVANKYKFYEFFPRNPQLKELAQQFCEPDSRLHSFCFNVVCMMGFTPQQLNKTVIPLLANNAPSGISIQQLLHAQTLFTGRFEKFDYGLEENMKRYGQVYPPKYDLCKTEAPVALYHGSEDSYEAPKNLDQLDSVLNIVSKKIYSGFGHMDVIWGMDAPKMIFKDILRFMKSFQRSRRIQERNVEKL